MKIIDGPSGVQGSHEWLTRRATARNGSDAPAVLGESDYMTRDDLLRRVVSGVAPEVSPWQQRIFDNGHAVEPALRAYAERVIGDDLSPVCATSDDDYLSCSFDGVTFDEETIAEFKQPNAAKMADIERGILPKTDRGQIVQGFDVNENAKRCIYVCGDGTEENTRHLIVNRADYEADIKRLRAAWALFDEDRKTYVVEPKRALVVAAPQEALPVVSVRVDGSLAVVSNLDLFGAALQAFIERIPEKPETDQQFADCEAACKTLKKAEEALAAAENNALAQVSDVEAMRRTVADFNRLSRDVRLRTERLVKAEKENRKTELIVWHVENLHQYVLHINQEFGAYAMPWQNDWPRIFGQAIKGMSSLDSMKAKLGECVAAQKIEFNEDAAQLRQNIKLIEAVDEAHQHLFPDRVRLCGDKNTDDLRNLIALRIAQAKEAEAKRLEAERERIRAEEEAKARQAAEAEQRERAWQAEIAAAEERRAQEAQARAAATEAEAATARNQVPAAPIPRPRGRICQVPPGIPYTEEQFQRPETADDHTEEPTLTLGAINKRLTPISITTAGIASFSIVGLHNKNAVLYTELQFTRLLRGLVEHLGRVAVKAQSERTEAKVA